MTSWTMRTKAAVGARALLAGIAIAGGSLATLAVASAPAGAKTPTFTWSGGGGGDTNWSDGANWVGGVAPTAGPAVNVTFAPVSCTGFNCNDYYTPTNDVTGLVVATMTMQVQSFPCGPAPDRAWWLQGNPVTITKGLVQTRLGNGFCTFDSVVDFPVALGANNSWTFASAVTTVNPPDPFHAESTEGITGNHTLKVTMKGAGVAFDGTTNVGAVAVTSQNNGQFEVPDNHEIVNGITTALGSLNVNGAAVKASNVYFSAAGPVGPFSASGGHLTVGRTFAPYASLSMSGKSGLAASTHVVVENLTGGNGTPVAGTDYPQLATPSSFNAGSGKLDVYADCNLSVGTVFNLVQATGGLKGTFTADSPMGKGTIKSGAILQALKTTDGTCPANATAPFLRYTYNDKAGTLTLTVVATAAGAGVGSSAPPAGPSGDSPGGGSGLPAPVVNRSS